MENRKFCQSCSMPLDTPELCGTEKNGTKSTDYCMFCYKDGAFINPDMTLDEMKTMVEQQMKIRQIDDHLIALALGSLPYLKRWAKAEMI